MPDKGKVVKGPTESTTVNFADRKAMGDKTIKSLEAEILSRKMPIEGFMDKQTDGKRVSMYHAAGESMVEQNPDVVINGWSFHKVVYHRYNTQMAGYVVVKRAAKRKRLGVILSWDLLAALWNENEDSNRIMEDFLNRCLYEHGYDWETDTDEKMKLHRAIEKVADKLHNMIPKINNVTPVFQNPMIDTHQQLRVDDVK